MQVYGEDATEGSAGECVALNIPELDHEAVRRGMVLCGSNSFEPVTMIEAELKILKSISGKIEDYLEVQFHVGTASVAAKSGNAGKHGNGRRTKTICPASPRLTAATGAG